MLSTEEGNLVRSTGRCACAELGTQLSGGTAGWYIEKSFPKEEVAAVTVKALEASFSPVLLLLEVPEETPYDVRQVPKLLLTCELLLHGWNPLTGPGAPSETVGEHEGLGSPILLQVSASMASGVLPNRGSSCGNTKHALRASTPLKPCAQNTRKMKHVNQMSWTQSAKHKWSLHCCCFLT